MQTKKTRKPVKPVPVILYIFVIALGNLPAGMDIG